MYDESNNLSFKEQKILWNVLNQAQHIGLSDIAIKIKQFESKSTDDVIHNMLVNWMEQTQDEYDIINLLKAKLCCDLE